MSWLDWAAAVVGGYYAYTKRDDLSKDISDVLDSFRRQPEAVSAEIQRWVLQESNKGAGQTAERIIDESELPAEVRKHMTAEEQKEKLLEAIASENNASKRAELIKQLKALK